MVSPFILHCFSFSLTGNEKVRNRWRGVNELYGLYLLHHDSGQMHVCLIASSFKITTKHVLSCTNSNQPGWFHVETYMHVLGMWFANTAGAKIIIKWVRPYIGRSDRLVDQIVYRFILYWFISQTTKYVTFYAWINRFTHLSTCNLPIQLLLCVNKLLLTSTWL